MKAVTIWIFCMIMIFWATGIRATETINQPSQNDQYYPKVDHPPGFYEGVILFSLMGGQTLAPSGSYIKDEKYYDDTVRTRIQLGEFGPPSLLQPGVVFQPEYLAENIYQMDIEYGVWEHFGLGLTLFQFYMNARRQDIHNLPNNIVFYDPLPTKSNLYQGTGASMLFSYHPFTKKFIDPYLVLRAGVVGFTGEGHQGPYKDATRFSNKIHNGLGAVIGGGLGTNVFIGRKFGIKLEADYYQQFLKSDLFSKRNLNTYHAQIGFFMNVSSLAADM
ncbi:MAG: hypothetical protein KDK39_06120 [Leptospiraceae bacterium]|nr:hypothetical protein [Leptospiraceae bacterium]